MAILFDPAPDAAGERVLLVMLPGVNDHAASFFSHGLVQALRKRQLPIDALGFDADFPVYADGSLFVALHAEITRVTRERGTTRIWFLGTSLGAMGSLMYCRTYPGSVEGVVLLAPYLGSRRVLTQVERAGGLERWQPDTSAPGDMEWRVLDWLRCHLRAVRPAPHIYLGYGRGDPFVLGSTLLEPLLPQAQTVAIDGAHDWATWSALWERIVGHAPFCIDANSAAI
ncbi:lysophospholipase [Trinickia sp. LjRoot230]|uniref:hypothetical protein n=1 Tax=Trinickia sp. LjRoot230 TaxID=3342288 RepID=UPI003ED11DF0